MLRSVVGKVMWVGRATVFLVGLAVILALVLGVATTALGVSPAASYFKLGQINSSNAISALVGAVGGPNLRVQNNSTDPNATALELQVPQGKPPLTVNAGADTATNLNADKVDGSEGEMWAQINADGTASNWKGLTGSSKPGTGAYTLTFARDVKACAITATPVDIPITGTNFISRFISVRRNNPTLGPNQVHVDTSYADGTDIDTGFDIIVSCGDHQSP